MPVGTVASVYIKGIERRYKSRYYSGKHLSFIFTPTNGDPGESRWFYKMNWDRNILTDSGGYQVYPFRLTEKSRKKG
jgi:queuine tRNA-ribosyltransferase